MLQGWQLVALRLEARLLELLVDGAALASGVAVRQRRRRLLREQGLRAPLQIYRALSKLIESGSVHRIESLNAFVACKHHECSGHEVSIFMLCERCDEVTEAVDSSAATALAALCSSRGFTGTSQIIEITGVCQACQTAQH